MSRSVTTSHCCRRRSYRFLAHHPVEGIGFANGLKESGASIWRQIISYEHLIALMLEFGSTNCGLTTVA